MLHDFDSGGDVCDSTAAGEVGDRVGEALQDGAGNGVSADLLESFVEEIAGVEIGRDEDVGLAGDGGMRGFLVADSRIDGGIELHFSVNEEVSVGEIF